MPSFSIFHRELLLEKEHFIKNPLQPQRAKIKLSGAFEVFLTAFHATIFPACKTQ